MNFVNIEMVLQPKGDISYTIDEVSKVYKEDDSEFTYAALEWMNERYSEAVKENENEFKSCKSNIRLFRHKIVSKFFGCNCGGNDNVIDIDENGNMNREFMLCPARLFCKNKKGGCEAVPTLKLTPDQLPVVELLSEGMSQAEIAEILNIDVNNVKGRTRNACQKFKIEINSGKLVAYCRRNNLI